MVVVSERIKKCSKLSSVCVCVCACAHICMCVHECEFVCMDVCACMCVHGCKHELFCLHVRSKQTTSDTAKPLTDILAHPVCISADLRTEARMPGSISIGQGLF